MKHALKALAAAATLSLSAGYSHAALYTMDVSWTTTVVGCPAPTATLDGCTGSGTATGTWDTVTNVLNYTGNEIMHLNFNDGNGASNGIINRTFTIDTDALTYTYVNNSCTDDTTKVCSSFAQGVDGASRPMGDKIGLITPPSTTTVTQLAGFVWNGTDLIRTTQTGVQNRKFTFSNLQPAAPAVPVPAAAWLFGSGLLGLAGAARKRR